MFPSYILNDFNNKNVFLIEQTLINGDQVKKDNVFLF